MTSGQHLNSTGLIFVAKVGAKYTYSLLFFLPVLFFVSHKTRPCISQRRIFGVRVCQPPHRAVLIVTVPHVHVQGSRRLWPAPRA
jgi:hypothetical protein